MSWHATAWVKDLQQCPDGARLSRGQKLLLFVLADYHNTTVKQAWPSVHTIACESLLSMSQTRRDLLYLEEHFVIERCRPRVYGRGISTAYIFLALDAPERLEQRLQKGVHGEPLFKGEPPEQKGVQSSPQNNSKGCHLGPEKGSEGEQIDDAYIEERRTIEQKQHAQKNKHAQRVLNPVVQKSLAVWLAAKNDLRAELGEDAWKLWIRSAMLLNVLSEKYLLIALPPSNRVVEAARANKHLVNASLEKRGCTLAGFTPYPDAWTREQMALRFPRAAKTMLGSASEHG
jgi:hypothetical protein